MLAAERAAHEDEWPEHEFLSWHDHLSTEALRAIPAEPVIWPGRWLTLSRAYFLALTLRVRALVLLSIQAGGEVYWFEPEYWDEMDRGVGQLRAFPAHYRIFLRCGVCTQQHSARVFHWETERRAPSEVVEELLGSFSCGHVVARTHPAEAWEAVTGLLLLMEPHLLDHVPE